MLFSKQTLDKLIPLPSEDGLLEQIKTELDEAGFPVSFYKSGGIFYTLLRIFVRLKIEFFSLARSMLCNVFVLSADNIDWLEVRAADYSKRLKQSVKTQGNITLFPAKTFTSLKVAKGCVFKTEPGADGEELRYFSASDVFFAAGEDAFLIPVEAEAAGSVYNVPDKKITRCLIHLEGIERISNEGDWITREGADAENIESLRSRTLSAWSELATMPTRDKYKSVCEAVEGVLYVSVDDMHPRGQGSVDISVISPTGGASDALLKLVYEAAMTVAGPYDNVLVKSSETVPVDICVTIVLPAGLSIEGVADIAEQTVRELFTISNRKILNEMYISDVIVALKTEIRTAKSVRVTEPANDIILSADKVIILRHVNVAIERA